MVLKRFAVILVVISLFAFTLQATGLSITTDGIADEKIWLDAPTQVLVSSADDSNNGVTFALSSCVYDEEANRAYLLFKVNTNTAIDSSTQHGLRINVDNSGFIGVSSNGVEPYDTSLYLIESGTYDYSNGAFSVEICLGVKLGLRSLENIEVMFVDGNGVPSNAYTLSLPDLPSEETTTQFLPQTTVPTTAETTTDNTMSINATEPSAESKTEKTTKQKKATVAKTTKAKTTKVRTTKAKTTKAKTTAKVVTVYITVTETVNISNHDATAESTLVSEEQQTYKELKYAAVAGLVILIFGLCVIINMNNDKNKNK